MSLLERIQQAKADPEITGKFDHVADDLFGDRNKIRMPPKPTQEYDEPGDHDFEPIRSNPYSHEQMQYGRNILNQVPGFNLNDYTLSISDEYLRTLARMKVSSLNLKFTLKTEPIKFIASRGFKFIGKDAKAEEIKAINIKDELGEYDDLLQEVVFQELKHLQATNNLRVPRGEELMSHVANVFFKKLAGDGFENVFELGDGLIKKFKNGKKY